MPPLPSLDECGLEGTGLSIWRTLLEAERTALEDAERSKVKYNDPVIGIRLLGFFLMDFRAHTQDFGNKAIYDALVKLSLMYRNYLLRVFRSNTGGRPTPSQHASRPSFDVAKGKILKELGEAEQTKKSVKKQALLRDGHRCAISRVYDVQSCHDFDEVQAAMVRENSKAVETEVAHIFSESAQDGDKDYPTTVFENFEMFGLGEKVKSLYGGQVNSLHNVITMAHDLHTAFDSFKLWLEPVAGQENTYYVRGKGLNYYLLPIPSRVTFIVDPDAADAAKEANKTFALPDPTLIAIRAACARVANLSGAAEQADRIFRDLEDTTVLANDGSMADLLSSRLSTSAPRLLHVQAQG